MSQMQFLRLKKYVDGISFGDGEESSPFLSEKFADQLTDLSQKIHTDETDYDLKFAFITDSHDGARPSGSIPKNYLHLRNVAEFSRMEKLDAVIHGGDIMNDYVPYKDFISRLYKNLMEFRRAKCPTLITQGNHDTNDAYAFKDGQENVTRVTTQSEWDKLSSFHNENIVYGDASKSYYYKDFPDQKIRIVVLNTHDAYILDENDKPKYNRSYGWGEESPPSTLAIRQAQLDWLSGVALDFEGKDDYSVFVVSHASFMEGSGVSQGYRFLRNARQVLEIVKARKNNGSISRSENTSSEDFATQIDVDFSNANVVNVIGCISGHGHLDNLMEYEGLNAISVTSSVNTSDDTDSAWDVFCIDKSTRTVRLKRFGDRGEDREFTY